MERYRKRREDKRVRSKVVSFKITTAEFNILLNLCERYKLTKAELLSELLLELNEKVNNERSNKQ